MNYTIEFKLKFVKNYQVQLEHIIDSLGEVVGGGLCIRVIVIVKIVLSIVFVIVIM